jgi:hypothetical protein
MEIMKIRLQGFHKLSPYLTWQDFCDHFKHEKFFY